MHQSEESIQAIFYTIIKNQPNLRALYSEKNGVVIKEIVPFEQVESSIPVYHREPREGDVTHSTVPACAMYIYEREGKNVFSFRMHHIGADAGGGFHILKSLGLLDLGVKAHWLVEKGIGLGLALAAEGLFGGGIEAYLKTPSVTNKKKQFALNRWRAENVDWLLKEIAPYFSAANQKWLQIGIPDENPKLDVFH